MSQPRPFAGNRLLVAYVVVAAGLLGVQQASGTTLTEEVPYLLLGLLSALAVAVGTVTRRLQPAWPGWCLAGHVLCMGLGDALFTSYELAGRSPYPSAADAFYLVSYPLLLVAVLGLGGRPRVSGPVLIDAAAVAVAAALPLWVLVAAPAAAQGAGAGRVVGLCYPLFDLVVLVAASGVLLGRRCGPGGWLLAAAVAGLIVSDICFAVDADQSPGGDMVDLGWLLERVLLAVLALSSLRVGATSPLAPEPARPRVRLLTALSVTAPLSLVLHGSPDRVDVAVVAAGAVLLTLLVLLRLSGVARELRAALAAEERNVRAAQAVADAGSRLLVGLDRGQVHRGALAAVLQLLDAQVPRAAAALALGPAQLLELVAADGHGLTAQEVAQVDLRLLGGQDLQALARGEELRRAVGPDDGLLVLALRAGATTIGALLVAAPSRALDEAAPRLRALVPQLALALEAARLREAAEHRRATALRNASGAAPGPLVRQGARPTLVTELTRGLREREFVVHYQPIVALEDGRPKGFEALVRWQHPLRGLLLPGQFLPQFQECGLLGQLDSSVLLQACRQASRWTRTDPGAYVSVNVSAEQLVDKRFVGQVRSVLDATGLAPWRLLVEVTETAAIEDPAAAAEVLGRLRAMRVRIAFDDFGTGYSSLSWLQQLPLDVVKIDKSFVDRLPQPGSERPVVEALVRLAQTLRLEVVAEGVEREDQRAALLGMGVNRAQGWLFSRAVPADEARRLLPRPTGATDEVPPLPRTARPTVLGRAS